MSGMIDDAVMEDPTSSLNVVIGGEVKEAGSSITRYLTACHQSGLEGDVALTSSDGETFFPHQVVLAFSPLLNSIFNQVDNLNGLADSCCNSILFRDRIAYQLFGRDCSTST